MKLLDLTTGFAIKAKSDARSVLGAANRRTIVAASAIALVSALATQPSIGAGRVFYDGFESGTSQWSKDDFRDLCLSVSTSVDGVAPRAGGRMLECNWNGTTAWNATNAYSTAKLNAWSYSSEFLIRFWVRYASDVDRKAGAKLFRMSPPPGNGGDSFYLGAQMETASTTLLSYWETIAGRAGPLFWGDSSSLGNGQWHKLEIYVKHNTPGLANGTLRVWQDGLLKQQAVNIVTIATGDHWYPIYLMSNWSNNAGWEHDASNHVYWDEFEIYSDTGAGGVGFMSDASITNGGVPPPATPQHAREAP